MDTLIALLGADNEAIRLGAVKEFFDRLYGKVEVAKEVPSWLSEDQIVEKMLS